MKAFFVIGVLCVLWSPSECQDFCDSFQSSGHKLFVHKPYPQYYGLLIIGEKYWMFEFTDDFNHLIFDFEKPSDSSDLLPNYSFGLGWLVGVDHEGNKVFGSGLYNPKTRTVDEIHFNDNGVIDGLPKIIKVDPIDIFANISLFGLDNKAFDEAFIRVFNSSIQSFEYISVLFDINYSEENALIDVKRELNVKQNFNEQYEYYLKNGYHLIGTFDNFPIFSNNVTIVYCNEKDCGKGEQEKQVLVDCQKNNEETTTKISTIISTPTPNPTTSTSSSSSTTTTVSMTPTRSRSTTTSSSTPSPKTTTTSANPQKPQTIWDNTYVRITLVLIGVFIAVVILLIVGILIAFWPKFRGDR